MEEGNKSLHPVKPQISTLTQVQQEIHNEMGDSVRPGFWRNVLGTFPWWTTSRSPGSCDCALCLGTCFGAKGVVFSILKSIAATPQVASCLYICIFTYLYLMSLGCCYSRATHLEEVWLLLWQAWLIRTATWSLKEQLRRPFSLLDRGRNTFRIETNDMFFPRATNGWKMPIACRALSWLLWETYL